MRSLRKLLKSRTLYSLSGGILYLLLMGGCALDIARERVGTPLDIEAYEELKVGESDLGVSLEKLGAPHLIERENDDSETHLWWVHRDLADINFRFQFPVSVLGYRHNVFQYFQGDEQSNTFHLVFDDAGNLLSKEVQIAEDYLELDEEGVEGRFHISPRVEYSFLLDGDADIDDYDELFHRGPYFGLDIGYQPVAPLTLGLNVGYQQYQGRHLEDAQVPTQFHDLELYSAEISVRLQVPFEVFSNIFDYQELRRVLLTEDPALYDGWLLYVEGTVGVTFNEDVPVEIQNVRTGDFIDDGLVLSNTAGVGIEYSLKHMSFRLGGTLRTLDAFESGNSPLADDLEELNIWGVSASLSLKF